MAEEVERLVLEPFRSIVEKGKTAIENVESEGDQGPEPMLKAAQNLVKEGERALKKIEPVSTAHFEEYGSNFIDAIKENDVITQFRSALEDLLWDFDDYLEVDEFDVAKFEELQKASRKAAPMIWDIIKCMKLVAPAPAPPISPPPSEGRPASMTTQTVPANIQKMVGEVNGGVSDMIGTGAGPDTGLWGDIEASRPPRSHSGPSEPPSEPPPTPPSTNPWQVGRTPLTKLALHPRDGENPGRRLPAEPDSPTIPHNQLVSPVDGPLASARPRGVDDTEEDERRMRAPSQSHASNSEGSLSPTHSHQWMSSTQGSADANRQVLPRPYRGFTSIQPVHQQENDTHALSPHTQSHDHPGPRTRPVNSHVIVTPSSRPDGRSLGGTHANGAGLPPRSTSVATPNSSSYVLSSRKSSAESVNSSVFDVVDDDIMGPGTSNASGVVGHRHSVPSTTSTSTSTAYHPATHPPPRYPGPPPFYQTPTGQLSPRRLFGSQSPEGHTAHLGTSNGTGLGIDSGLIPVDMDASIPNDMPIPPRDPDCTITPSSSFYKLKGFCKGAEEAQRGQLGFKRIKRPIGGFSTTVVAKCTHCLYELDYKLVEQDLHNESSGNFTSNTVGFRLRVLQKSHLPIRIIEEQLYGCLFCIQQGHTLEESDATVFFNQRQLFTHMARHPRPLPRVSGLTVIGEPELPPNLKDNFDLHFPHEPTESVMTGIAREVARLPAATATETRKMSHGAMRLPPDRQPVLHFAVGARIVGIEFPAKYEGKWAIGWHDGVRAAFETDAIRLEAPPKAEVRMQGTSSVQTVARWKWNQKGDDRWLKFDKGDVIKNISWVYADHWCWSGTTSKGSGIFPQSHIDPNSLRSNDGSDSASVSSWERKNPLKFTMRKKEETRKLGSFSSQETSTNTWRPNVY